MKMRHLNKLQINEILKKNIEIKKRSKGEEYNDKDRLHYESQKNLYRETIGLRTDSEKDYIDDRNVFMKNFESFLNNLDIDNDPEVLQEQVDSYIDQWRVINENRKGMLGKLEDNTPKPKDPNDDSSVFRWVRKEMKNNPIGDKGRQRDEIEDFESQSHMKKKMQDQLKKMNESLRKKKEFKKKHRKDREEKHSKIDNRSRVSNKNEESGFFSTIWSFLPFTCSGRKNEEYDCKSDDEKDDNRKKKNRH